MATTDQNDKTQAALHKAEQERLDAEKKLQETNDGKTDEQRKAEAERNKVDDKVAKLQAKTDGSNKQEDGGASAAQLKNVALFADGDLTVGDHLAQKFSNTPANPAPAPDVDFENDKKVKLVMETSDTLAAGQQAVIYVPKEMVGDYLRAGWSRG